MRDRSARSTSGLPADRHPDPPPDEADIAGIYEARLLARGIRSEEFLALRSAAVLPQLPGVSPVRFGRGGDSSAVAPIAPVEPAPPPPPADDEPA